MLGTIYELTLFVFFDFDGSNDLLLDIVVMIGKFSHDMSMVQYLFDPF